MTAVSLDITLFAVKLAVVFFVTLTLAAYLVFAERKIPACASACFLSESTLILLSWEDWQPDFFWGERGTLPRLRYDQLIHLGWKILTPLALVNMLITGWWHT